MSQLVGCCDIGGTTLRVALADRAGILLARKSFPHAPLDAEATIETVAFEIEAMARERGQPVLGVGTAVPGPLDAASGIVYFSPNLGWRTVPFATTLSARLGVPVALDDDANCAALGEHWRAGNSVRDFLYVGVGTGIGAGLVLNGSLYRGAGGGAGEIGHTTLLPDGPLCTCGNRGCVEALAAGPALARRFAERRGAETTVAARDVIASARAGDVLACEVLEETGTFFGIALANAVNLLNPEIIAVGGGVARDAGELYLTPARREMKRRAFSSSAAAVQVVPATLGDDAGLVGAARLIWDKLEEGQR